MAAAGLLLAVSVYPQLSPRFAFKIGGENRPEWIMARHSERCAKAVGLSMR
jgi:serine/threonine-protein kinase HipA